MKKEDGISCTTGKKKRRTLTSAEQACARKLGCKQSHLRVKSAQAQGMPAEVINQRSQKQERDMVAGAEEAPDEIEIRRSQNRNRTATTRARDASSGEAP